MKRLLAVIAVMPVVGIVALLVVHHRDGKPTKPDVASSVAHAPTLYCDFYDLMRKSIVVSFDFAVDVADAGRPIFRERFIVEPDNTRTDFGGSDQPPPVWHYGIDDGTPTIASADDETRIVLYGLKSTTPGVFWFEAGVRSNRYRNLEGKCRQAYFSGLSFGNPG